MDLKDLASGLEPSGKVFSIRKGLLNLKKQNKRLCLLLMFCFLYAFGMWTNTIPAFASDHISVTTNAAGQVSIEAAGAIVNSAQDGYGLVLNKYKMIGQGIVGLCTIISITALIFYITKLGAAGDNPRLKQSAFSGVMYSGIALALFGGLSSVLYFWLSVLN